MKIAICEDNEYDLDRLKKILLKEETSFCVDGFTTGADLLAAFEKIHYDLVFMDIYLKDENGIEVVKELQAKLPSTQIVFTTTSNSHAVDAFNINALHYLVKPVSDEDITEVMRRMKQGGKAAMDRSTLTIWIGTDIYTLNQSEIIKVESDNHKTNIFIESGSIFSVWKPFGEITSLLDERFLTIKRGVAVNMRYIVKWHSKDCEMSDGSTYLLSRGLRAQAKETYYAFKIKEMQQL